MPGLGTVLVGRRPRQPALRRRQAPRLRRGRHRLDRAATCRPTRPRREVEAVVDELNADPGCTGYIVQLPLPAGLDAGAVLERMDPAKDADGLHPTNLGRLVLGRTARCPARRAASSTLLRRYDVPLAGAEVVVVGRGVTVGRPLGLLLTRRTENATVTLCHTGTRDLAAHLRRADIVVAAAGRARAWSPPDLVRPGAAVARRRHHPHRRRVWSGDVAPEVREVAGLRRADARRGRPDDPGDAAAQRGRARRARRRPEAGTER